MTAAASSVSVARRKRGIAAAAVAAVLSWTGPPVQAAALSAAALPRSLRRAAIAAAAARTSAPAGRARRPPSTGSLASSSPAPSFSSLPSPSTTQGAPLLLPRSCPERVAIVGGGLAGLATAYHLLGHHEALQRQLQRQRAAAGGANSAQSADIRPLAVTIYDTHPVGAGGASAVAGGFLHPLSPRGRLAHLGLEGLASTGRLVREAVRHGEGRSAEAAATTSQIVLRDEIYRVAASERQAQALRETAESDANLSRLAEWIPSYGAFGALRLHSGCQVLHVPSYLKGLWRACQAKCSSDIDREANVGRSARWVTVGSSGEAFRGDLLEPYDAVVFAAGAGMLASEGDSAASPLLATARRLPAHLVGGQSLVMALPDAGEDDAATEPLLRDAILCGKYASPLPEPGLVLVGATHEFQPAPWTTDRVFEELRDRTAGCLWPPELASALWDRGRVRTVTRGVRVQTARGEHGRLPIVGRLDCPPDRSPHPNAWLFTGLSSRGLLYHAWFGDKLARAVLSGSEDALRAEPTDLLWWKSRGDALVRAPSGNAE